MHLEGADLHFQCLALGADDGGVQGAVVVLLRVRDVVVELATEVGPQVVHDAEGGVAVLDVVHEDADRADVEQALEPAILALHLAPDAVDVLRPAGHLRHDPGRRELTAQDALDLLDERFALFALLLQRVRDIRVDIGLRVAKCEIFEFPLELPDAQPVRECRVDLARFGRHGPLLGV